MIVITSDGLTTAERKTLEQHSDGYHDDAEFWLGFADYQNNPDSSSRWGKGLAGEAWDRGYEAAMRVVIRRKPVLDMYDRDDLESLLQIATLRGVAEKRRQGREKIVGLIHARSRHLAERNPRESSSKLTEKQLRQAIELGTQLAEEEALFKLAMKAKQVAELDRQRPRLVWDRDRGYIN
jgi:hypothetical protein